MIAERRNGILFVGALFFLLVFSGGFLTFLITDGSEINGVAAALESPDLPPSISTPPADAPPIGEPPAGQGAAPSEQASEAVLVPPAAPISAEPEPVPVVVAPPLEPPAEPQKVSEKPVEPPKVKVPVKPQASDKVPGKKPQEKKPVEPAPKKEVKVNPPASAAVEPKVTEKTPGKSEEKKPAGKKSRKAKKNSAPSHEEVPSVVPPEWDWFPRGLKAEIAEGRIEIVSSGEPAAPVSIGQAISSTPAGNVPEKIAEIPITEEAESNSSIDTPAPVIEKVPFSDALAKMEKKRAQREDSARNLNVGLPSKTGSFQKVPSTLVRLNQMVSSVVASDSEVSKEGSPIPQPSGDSTEFSNGSHSGPSASIPGFHGQEDHSPKSGLSLQFEDLISGQFQHP